MTNDGTSKKLSASWTGFKFKVVKKEDNCWIRLTINAEVRASVAAVMEGPINNGEDMDREVGL